MSEPDWKSAYQRACQEATLALSAKVAAEARAKRLLLTDAEREALNMARSIMLVEHDLSVGAEIGGKQPRRSSGYWWTMADSLRGLLERNGSLGGRETGQ